MYLTVKEAAARAGVSAAALYLAIAEGRLRSERRYGRIVIGEKDAAAYAGKAGVRNGYARQRRQGREEDGGKA